MNTNNAVIKASAYYNGQLVLIDTYYTNRRGQQLAFIIVDYAVKLVPVSELLIVAAA